jgi:uncharacterized protein
VPVLKKYLLKQFKLLAIALFTLAIAFQVFTSNAIALEVYDIPELPVGDRTWLQDMAKVLSSSTEGAVKSKIDELAEKTDFQVRLLTVKRIDFGQPTQEFTDLVFDKWFTTPESKANQAVIVFATDDHRTAISTGDRVKAVLPNAISASIADETMLFPAKKSNYNQAAIDGINRLAAVLTGEPDPGPPKIAEEILPQSGSNFKTAKETDGAGSTIVVVGLLIAATVIPMVTYFWFQNQS